jgi:hypothetical protein
VSVSLWRGDRAHFGQIHESIWQRCRRADQTAPETVAQVRAVEAFELATFEIVCVQVR